MWALALAKRSGYFTLSGHESQTLQLHSARNGVDVLDLAPPPSPGLASQQASVTRPLTLTESVGTILTGPGPRAAASRAGRSCSAAVTGSTAVSRHHPLC